MLKNGLRELKFPENQKINAQLLPGDREIIAKYSNYTVGTIREMMGGYRRITDRAGKAIVRLFEERKQLTDSLNEIANLGASETHKQILKESLLSEHAPS